METVLATWAMVSSAGCIAAVVLWAFQHRTLTNVEREADVERSQARHWRQQHDKAQEEIERLQGEIDALDIEYVGSIDAGDLANALTRGVSVHKDEVRDGGETGPVPDWVDGDPTEPGHQP